MNLKVYTQMDNHDDNEYIEEYKSLLSTVARLIAENPNAVDSLRETLKLSAQLMWSNNQQTVIDYRKLTDEMDSFILACKTGEIDPKSFIDKKEES